MINLFETILQNPQYFKQLKCRDLLFTQYRCLQEDRRQDLFSDHNYIAYIISGKRTFVLPGETHVMTEGKCVFAKKGAWIAEKELGDEWCVLVFFIPDQYLKQFLRENRSNFSLAKSPTNTQQMIPLSVNQTTAVFFHSMIPYFTMHPPMPEELLELKFKELLFNILINQSNANLLQWMMTLSDNMKQPLQQVMEANYSYNLSLSDYAKISNRSLASFKREFQNIYGTTPGKWLIQKRLDHAHMLLSTSSKNIKEVAFDSGFENATHFSRLFKDKFGTAPSTHRNEKTNVNA